VLAGEDGEDRLLLGRVQLQPACVGPFGKCLKNCVGTDGFGTSEVVK
jgi:hypothetical protein